MLAAVRALPRQHACGGLQQSAFTAQQSVLTPDAAPLQAVPPPITPRSRARGTNSLKDMETSNGSNVLETRQSYAIAPSAGLASVSSSRGEYGLCARINRARHNEAIGGVVTQTGEAPRSAGHPREWEFRHPRPAARHRLSIPDHSFSRWAGESRTTGNSILCEMDRAHRAARDNRSDASGNNSSEAAPARPPSQAQPPCSTSKAEVPARGWRTATGTAAVSRSYLHCLRRLSRGQAPARLLHWPCRRGIIASW